MLLGQFTGLIDAVLKDISLGTTSLMETGSPNIRAVCLYANKATEIIARSHVVCEIFQRDCELCNGNPKLSISCCMENVITS